MACSIECPLISRAPGGRRSAAPRMRSREAMALAMALALEAPAGHGVESSRGQKETEKNVTVAMNTRVHH
mgnify:CR=1 FL=1